VITSRGLNQKHPCLSLTDDGNQELKTLKCQDVYNKGAQIDCLPDQTMPMMAGLYQGIVEDLKCCAVDPKIGTFWLFIYPLPLHECMHTLMHIIYLFITVSVFYLLFIFCIIMVVFFCIL